MHGIYSVSLKKIWGKKVIISDFSLYIVLLCNPGCLNFFMPLRKVTQRASSQLRSTVLKDPKKGRAIA